MKIDGSCHCGQISFTAEIDPAQVAVCHCTDCQVLSGAPFRTIVTSRIETFALRCQPKTYIKV
ncbi:MAG: GFA family protein, partial [Pseudomonadota bacterium]|nr:GFA family protein [Pseudomonadota bacterium]